MIFVGCLGSLVARFTVSDLFYLAKFNLCIPLVFLLPFGLLGAAFCRLGWKVRLPSALLFCLGCAVAFRIEQPRLLAQAPTEQPIADFDILTYNVKSYSWGSDAVVETILDHDPDILCLVEGTFGSWAPPKVEKALGSDYNWAVGDLMSIASRFPILESEMLVSRWQIKVIRVRIDTPKGVVTVLSVDLATPRLRDDSTVFAELSAFVKNEKGPVIVTGDFNTPRGSRRLQRATASLADTFAEAGDAPYLATWPTYFPLWQIDHVFHGNGVSAVWAHIGSSRASDHAPISAGFTMDAEAVRKQ